MRLAPFASLQDIEATLVFVTTSGAEGPVEKLTQFRPTRFAPERDTHPLGQELDSLGDLTNLNQQQPAHPTSAFDADIMQYQMIEYHFPQNSKTKPISIHLLTNTFNLAPGERGEMSQLYR